MSDILGSYVWKYFTVDPVNDTFAICSFCLKRFSRGGRSHNTSNLRKHLSVKHRIGTQKSSKPTVASSPSTSNCKEMECECDEPETSSPSTSSNCSQSQLSTVPNTSPQRLWDIKKSKKSLQPTLSSFIESKTKYKPGDPRAHKISRLIGEMICKDNQPFCIVEDDGFKSLVQHLEPRYIMPSRKFFSNSLLPELYQETKLSVMKLLEDATCIAVTTDMWTSTANDDYMSLTVHFLNASFHLEHLCIEVVPFPEISHTGVNIGNFLSETLKAWNLADKVVSIVHDNAANIENALKASGFPHSSCLAHTLQLVVKDGILQNNIVVKLIAACHQIVGHFKHSSKATKILNDAQDHVGVPKHRLIQDEKTRWNSTLHILARLYEQRRALTLASSDLKLPAELSASQWALMANIIEILNIFDKATFAVSSATVTSSEVIPIVNSMLSELDKPAPVGSGLGGLKNDLKASLSRRFADMEGNTLYCLSTLLDPRLKGSVFISESMLELARENLLQEINILNQSCESPADPTLDLTESAESGDHHGMWSLYSKIMKQPSAYKPNSRDEVDTYLKEPLQPPTADIFSYWKNNSTFPSLKKLAVKYLCVPRRLLQCFQSICLALQGLCATKKGVDWTQSESECWSS